MVRDSSKTALSLFSGAGGLDVGLTAAGWDILTQVEMDEDSADTLRIHAKNSERPSEVIGLPIEEVDPAELRRSLHMRKGQLGLLAGGPPCQPFTTSGLRRALLDYRASSLFPAYLGFVREFRPHALLIENVDGLLSAALRHRPLRQRGRGFAPLDPDEMKGSFLRWFLDQLAELGYTVTWGVIEAADHGVAQMRQRAILIGVRSKAPCFLPEPTHGRPGLPRYRTVREALNDVKDLGPIQPLSLRKQAVYREIPPGGNWRDLPDQMRRDTMGAAYWAEGGRSGWWRRLSWDSPAPTILGMPDHSSTALIHPDEVRCLSVAECAALQSFPPSIEFAGSPRSQYQQVGNAVPPQMATRLGIHLSDFLDGVRQVEPESPAWRKASSNRRIGTHGWVVPRKSGPDYHIIVKIREDHVWSHVA